MSYGWDVDECVSPARSVPALSQTWSGVDYHQGSLDTSIVKFMSYHTAYFQRSNQVKDLQTDRGHVCDSFLEKIVYQVYKDIFLFKGVEDFEKAKLTGLAQQWLGNSAKKPQHWS